MTRAVLTVPREALTPAITHAPTRRRLTGAGAVADAGAGDGAGAGLPTGTGLMLFPHLAESRVVTVAHVVDEKDDAAELDPGIARLLVIGHLFTGSEAAHEILLDGDTGRVFTLEMSAPRHAEAFPLAPSLDALARFLTAVSELDALCGRFAPLAERTGADVAAEASALLLAVVTGEEWGTDGWSVAGDPAGWDTAVPMFWRITALFRPLSLIAAPGRGLRLELPKELLEEEFGPEGLVRADPSRIPDALEHGPTRRFLAEAGLPGECGLFWPCEPEDLLLTVSEDRERSRRDPRLRHLYDGTDQLPADAGHLLVLGGLANDLTVVLDGRTGEVRHMTYDGDTTTQLNADISTLAFTLWLYSREQALAERHNLTGDTGEFYYQLATTMLHTLATVDPVACTPVTGPDDFRCWPELFHDAAGGVL
ncbi:SUKH-4 family immunity protein [Streptomyces sp. NBC_01186]|uniref:SUKH-4 family immunity protein n=1 Tax=Streptomyces sp. NBC_01186 TaxID=2903765 RepID=UPI002E1384ED|nr:SUKH-4 family immunity protein [Streptomyces sp. NBC_01186]